MRNSEVKTFGDYIKRKKELKTQPRGHKVQSMLNELDERRINGEFPEPPKYVSNQKDFIAGAWDIKTVFIPPKYKGEKGVRIMVPEMQKGVWHGSHNGQDLAVTRGGQFGFSMHNKTKNRSVSYHPTHPKKPKNIWEAGARAEEI